METEETTEQWMARLRQTKKDLEAAGHKFGGHPMRCLKCIQYIGVLVNCKIEPCVGNLPTGR